MSRLYAVRMIKHHKTTDKRGRVERAYDHFHDLSTDFAAVTKSAKLYTQTSHADEIYVLTLDVAVCVRIK